MILTLRLETQWERAASRLIGLFSQIYEVLSAAANTNTNTNTVVTLPTLITRSGSVGSVGSVGLPP